MSPWNTLSGDRNNQPRCCPQFGQTSICQLKPGNQLQYTLGSPTGRQDASAKHPKWKRRPWGFTQECSWAPPTAIRAAGVVTAWRQNAHAMTPGGTSFPIGRFAGRTASSGAVGDR